MPVETWSEKSPFIRLGMFVASSTTSCPRAISPSASSMTLPCSDVMISASSALSRFRTSRNAKRICWRFASDVFAHPGNAAFALAIAAWTSDSSASATRFVATPSAGS